ncbi:MAG: phosphoribosylformylglycinamidine cyclo-ligase [Thermoproteota archaeon]|jgi:phosphoribosylformylglycinamidine cyclo-ligase|nr:phosphoribosylformylglycinamidine cyclo-ligase [Thermoproteota archaeon]
MKGSAVKKLPRTYKEAGVDIKAVKEVHEELGNIFKAKEEYSEFKPLLQIGHYAGVVEYGEHCFALHVDGVGTKILVAQMMNYFEPIGYDCVAMGVNDIICIGAKPVAFLDYLAVEKVNKKLITQIAKGISKAAEESGVYVIGGETAIMPEIIKGARKQIGFDLVGMTFGYLKKHELIDGSKIAKDDVIIGLESSGLHSNGYTLARKILLEKYSLTEKIPELGGILGEELLKPTKIYVKPILEAKAEIPIKGIAHITGGSFTKLLRLAKNKKIGFLLDKFPPMPAIFRLIMKTGKISIAEMFRTFNCGIGMCVILDKKYAERALDIFSKHKIKASIIGRVIDNYGVYVKYKGRKLVIA